MATARERNGSIEKSGAYFEALKIKSHETYLFYSDYGDGDLVEGYNKSQEEETDYINDLILLWTYYEETKGLKLVDLVEPVVPLFRRARTAYIQVKRYLWESPENRVLPERKLLVLRTLWNYHEEQIEQVKKHYS